MSSTFIVINCDIKIKQSTKKENRVLGLAPHHSNYRQSKRNLDFYTQVLSC